MNDLREAKVPDEHAHYEAVAHETIIDRWRNRLFPESPWPRSETDARTFISTDIYVHLDWLDRLRLLWSGRIHVKVTTYTDVLVNDAESLSVFSVPGR